MSQIPEPWFSFAPGPVQPVNVEWADGRLHMLRLDRINSWASGNKYYKLKYNLREALQKNITTIISKGGMFSNHLYALGEACHLFNLKCICLIRSYQDDPQNPTLHFLRSQGCELIFLEPDAFTRFDLNEAEERFPGCFFIPEGGESQHAIEGAGEIIKSFHEDQFQHVVISAGTMTTAVGLLRSASANQHIHIVPAWKGCTVEYVNSILLKYFITPVCQWSLWPDFHFGGFAKSNQELVSFMETFTAQTSIPLDPVYTCKMMFGLQQKMGEGFFGEGSILSIHTGGLQGIEGAYYRNPMLWSSYRDLCRSLN